MIGKYSTPESHLQLWVRFRSLSTKEIPMYRTELACWIKCVLLWGELWQGGSAPCVTLQPVPCSDQLGKDWLMVTGPGERQQCSLLHEWGWLPSEGFPKSLTVGAWADLGMRQWKAVLWFACYMVLTTVFDVSDPTSSISESGIIIRVVPTSQGSCASCSWVMKQCAQKGCCCSVSYSPAYGTATVFWTTGLA